MASEFGFYAQGPALGVAFGYDTENGYTLSAFVGASAIVAVEGWTSISLSIENGLQWEGFTAYAGYASPSVISRASRRVRDFTHHPYLTTIPAMQNIPPPTRQSY